MIVEDSRVIRMLLSRWVGQEPGLAVVAQCGDGREAVRQIVDSKAEVVVLDIEMPELDGLQALPELLKRVPGLQIVMASTLTKRNAAASLKAMALGATDCVAKPESLGGADAAATFRLEITRKVRELGKAARLRRGDHGPGAESTVARPSAAGRPTPPIALRPFAKDRPSVLAVGSSTGGPQALNDFLIRLKDRISVPILITQHMPATFTAILAEQLGRTVGLPCAEATDGERLRPRTIYLAPGDWHMSVAGDRENPRLRLDQGPPENYCRPAVDPLFRSVAKTFGNKALCVVLTGMGSDGEKGARVAVERGGTVLAQDADTSVVWGMPRAVAVAGLCSAVAPVAALADIAGKMLQGGQS